MTRLAAVLLALGLTGGLLTGCSGGGGDEPSSEPTTQAPAPTPTAAPEPPRPPAAGCYALTYDEALASTAESDPVDCRAPHTSQTFFVGTLATVVDGHLLAVDSARVRKQIATQCPRRFAAYVGGTPEARRLSMLSTVWYGPTLDQSDDGQSWLRCDVIALDSAGRLAPLTGSLSKVLDTAAGRGRWGRCATGKPGAAGSVHVICSRNDAWRAVASIDVRPGAGGAWPGEQAGRAAGATCEDRVRDLAADKLKFSWGYEWPTKAQWDAGQHYGFCWAPKRP